MLQFQKTGQGVFSDNPMFVITPNTGKKILQCCNSIPIKKKSISQGIKDYLTIKELIDSITSILNIRILIEKNFNRRNYN